MKQIIIILSVSILCFLPGFTQAQSLPLTREAAELLQSGDLELAKEKIDAAINSKEESSSPYTWFIHSYLYKEQYKKSESQDRESLSRSTAIESAMKSIRLDEDEEFKNNNIKILDYLTNSIYNDAAECAESNDPEVIKRAISYYRNFEASKKQYDGSFNLLDLKKDLHKKSAESYQNIYLNDKSQIEILELAIEQYKKALEVDSADYDSNYNLAINYYNMGVKEISNIDHNTPIHDLMLIQEDCVALFKKSLPFMLEAHSQTEKRIEPLKGLMAIFKALSEDEKSDYYKEKLNLAIENK